MAARRILSAMQPLLPVAISQNGCLRSTTEDVAVAERCRTLGPGCRLRQRVIVDERLTVRVYRRAVGGQADVIP
jgi:hypothetical protein